MECTHREQYWTRERPEEGPLPHCPTTHLSHLDLLLTCTSSSAYFNSARPLDYSMHVRDRALSTQCSQLLQNLIACCLVLVKARSRSLLLGRRGLLGGRLLLGRRGLLGDRLLHRGLLRRGLLGGSRLLRNLRKNTRSGTAWASVGAARAAWARRFRPNTNAGTG